MRKIFNVILFIVINIISISCTQKRTEYTIKVTVLNNKYTTAYLYGFWGDNQILIDSIVPHNGIFIYTISKTCNVGVYRLQFSTIDNFDFIYNNENIEISVDSKDFRNSIVVKESDENKLLYFYFNSFQKIQRNVADNQNRVKLLDSAVKIKYIDSINNCNRTEYSKIYNDIYGIEKNKKLFAYSIIQLLDVPNYDFYSVKNSNEKSLSKAEFLSQNCFPNQSFTDERLIATPYLSTWLQVYLDEFSKSDSLALNTAIKKLYMKSILNPYMSTFMNNFLYEYLYLKDYEANLDFYMNLISQGTLQKIDFNGLKKSKLVQSNECISESFEKYYKKSNQTLFVLCDTN